MLQRALDGTDGTLMEQDDAEGGEEGKSRKKPRFSDSILENLERIGLDAKTLEALDQVEYDEEQDSDDDSDESDTEEEEDDGEDMDLGEDTAELKDPDENEPSQKFLLSPSKKNKASKSSGGVHAKLDDGFFDLVSFNVETEQAEAKRVSRGRLGKNIEDEDSESEAESIDYFAPVESTEDLEATESGK
jgi:U3 small nucleolar RNA-associated protein MPP10